MAASPIQLFQSIQSYFRIFGFSKSQSDTTCSLNWRTLLAFFCYIQHFIAVFAFFVFEANTVLEYGTSFYGFITMIYTIFYILILTKRTPQIFQLIENFQEFIEKRKCSRINVFVWKKISWVFFSVALGVDSRSTYIELNAKIEQMCEKIYFFMVKVPRTGMVLFPLLTTITNYFILDLKDESYILPTPLMYVTCTLYSSYDLHSNGENHQFIRLFLFPFLKATFQLAYTIWIFIGIDLW